MQYLIEAGASFGGRSRFYNGIEKGRAKLRGTKRALKFEKDEAEKICGQLAKVHNLDWRVVPYVA